MNNRTLYASTLCIIMITLGIASCSSTKPATKPAATATSASTLVTANIAPGIEDDILNLVNNYRKTKGLPALQSNFVIASSARQHTMSMATRRVAFGHNGFSARSKYIISKVSGVKAVSENVGFGNQSAQSMVDSWLKSPEHKKNIEGNYRLTGIGVARDIKAKLYFTQIFAD